MSNEQRLVKYKRRRNLQIELKPGFRYQSIDFPGSSCLMLNLTLSRDASYVELKDSQLRMDKITLQNLSSTKDEDAYSSID